MGFLTKDKKYVLCATETSGVLVDVKLPKGRQGKVDLLSRLEKEPDASVDTGALLGGTGRKKAKVALILPLREFELVSVTVPPVSYEAVAKLLPYSLAKLIDVPVTDFIYDWQVAQKFKDRHELTVYLYSASAYKQFEADLHVRQKQIVWFEPDVFAACSYLYSLGKPKGDSSCLLLLVAGRSISITVFEDERISFVRNVDIFMPDGVPGEFVIAFGEDAAEGFSVDEEQDALSSDNLATNDLAEFFTEKEEAGDIIEVEEEIPTLEESDIELDTADFFKEDSHSADILSGFGLQASSSPGAPPPVPLATEEVEVKEDMESTKGIARSQQNEWAEYFENLNLEIMRTRDYHTSVLKGKPVQEIYIGGMEHCFEDVAKTVQETHNVETFSFPPEEIDTECSQDLAAICIGALQR